MVLFTNLKKHQVKSSLALFATPSSKSKSKQSARRRTRIQPANSTTTTQELWSSTTDNSNTDSSNNNNATDGDGTHHQPCSPSAPARRLSLPADFGTTAVAAVGPTALLVGGTAVLYNSLLHHPSSTLTPLSIVYMLLLAIQTSVQPRLSKRYIPRSASKVKVALVEEVLKTSVASVMLVATTSSVTLQDNILKDWTLQSSLLVAGIPATLYALQGVLTYRAHQHLDSVTFNGLSQTKTLWAALCCYLVMGKRQSYLQVVALGLLFGSALLFQSNSATGKNSNTASNNKEASADSSDNADLQPQPQSQRHDTANQLASLTSSRSSSSLFLYAGVLPCLGATFLSGLAGAFSQRGLQFVGGTGRNAFLYTVEVSFFSAVTLLATSLVGGGVSRFKTSRLHRLSGINNRGNHDNDQEPWTWQTYIPITCKAMGGILTALVHKHAGSVVKGFALMLGLVMSGILQSLWSTARTGEDDSTPTSATTVSHSQSRSLSIYQVAGIVVVMFSSWLHFTNPPI